VVPHNGYGYSNVESTGTSGYEEKSFYDDDDAAYDDEEYGTTNTRRRAVGCIVSISKDSPSPSTRLKGPQT
jgi:hypothetical protein